MATEEILTGSTNEAHDLIGKPAAAEARISRVRLRALAAVLPVLLPLLLLIGSGLYGLDFGFHWGEGRFLDQVKNSIDSGVLLPRTFYSYPSLSYWLSFAGSGFELGPALQESEGAEDLADILGGESLGLRSLISVSVLNKANLLRVRAFFLFVSSLAVVWVYLLLLIWKQNWIAALLAGLILALSWEIAYHLRWIAPDGLLMQFGALTILFAMLTRLRPSRGRTWLRLAALAAGLACGSKYQGALLLIPVLIAAFQSRELVSTRRGLSYLLIEIFAIFGLTYLLTTPGTLLEPLEFARDLFFERQHYQTGHFGHTVSAGLEHLKVNLSFFALSLASRYTIIAALLFLFALLGTYAVIVESRKLALILLSFPILYLLFMSLQRVMLLRNLLVLAPFFAILSARGIVLAWKFTSGKFVKVAFVVIVSAALIVNAFWLVSAAETIYNRSQERFVRQAAAYVEDHPQSRFFVSDRVWNDFEAFGKNQLSNITRHASDEADKTLFYTSEGTNKWPIEWPATRRNLTIAWFGPMEVDINYYPNWEGDDRILLMSMDTAREIGVMEILANADPNS